ncbi:BLUF domain-containing protein [Bacteriovoracaceae bacterium]|nr:BLUF domain-containing protein [Bacteriovoracaceae bacterium]
MFQLVYLSFASPKFNNQEDKGLQEILNVANPNNESIGVTGMLLYKGGVFMQLLEGNKNVVLNLFGRIGTDLRHEGIKILVKQEVEGRLFTDWTMGYRKIDNVEIEAISQILPWQEILQMTLNRECVSQEKIMEIFKKFRWELK